MKGATVINATCIGNLGSDATTKPVGQTSVTEFTLGCSSRQKDTDVTTWVRVSIWGARGEAVSKWLTKGKQVAASGQMRLREYTAKDGKIGKALEMSASDVKLLGSRDGGAGGRSCEIRESTKQAIHADSASADDYDDDQIPF